MHPADCNSDEEVHRWFFLCLDTGRIQTGSWGLRSSGPPRLLVAFSRSVQGIESEGTQVSATSPRNIAL